MSTSPSLPRVLVIGLDPYRVPGPWPPEPVAEAIDASMERLTGWADAETCLVGLDGSDDIGAVVAASLQTHPWECVVVGGGIRHRDDLLETFELIVNLVHRYAPGAAFAFNRRPEDVPEAIARVLELA